MFARLVDVSWTGSPSARPFPSSSDQWSPRCRQGRGWSSRTSSSPPRCFRSWCRAVWMWHGPGLRAGGRDRGGRRGGRVQRGPNEQRRGRRHRRGCRGGRGRRRDHDLRRHPGGRLAAAAGRAVRCPRMHRIQVVDGTPRERVPHGLGAATRERDSSQRRVVRRRRCPRELFGPPLRLAASARRFDVSPAWFAWVGTAPALELIEQIGVDAIHRHDVALANRFRSGIGLEPSNSAIVCAELPGAAERLERAGIVAAVRGGLTADVMARLQRRERRGSGARDRRLTPRHRLAARDQIRRPRERRWSWQARFARAGRRAGRGNTRAGRRSTAAVRVPISVRGG